MRQPIQCRKTVLFPREAIEAAGPDAKLFCAIYGNPAPDNRISVPSLTGDGRPAETVAYWVSQLRTTP